MENLKQIFQEINDLTLKMEQECPDLYQFLNENPVTIPDSEHPQMNAEIFKDYLNSLKQLFKHHTTKKK
ncbi:hypothetical protein [Pedobacter sp. JCM 36344]|uniref:hypothetical protein n=1 Tax=Pedobacter sp. JCM 36344 TaxID=3374280 RepID=UPI00397AA162